MKTKIKEIARIISGGDKPKLMSKTKTNEFNVPIIGNALENKGIYGYTNKSVVDENAITIAARGSNCGISFYRTEPYYPIVRLLSLIPDTNILDTRYFYYVIKNRNFKSTGSGQPQITIPQISDCEIDIIEDLGIQKKISSLLGKIDDKIECNNKIITILEDYGKTLYNYWFLQCEFPDKNGKPYKSSYGKMEWNESIKSELPIGWKVEEISNIVELYQPKTISEKELDIDGKYFVYGANGIIGKYAEYNHENSEIAICCRGANCGKFLMTQPKSWITGNSMVVSPKDSNLKEYIFYGLNDKILEKYITGSAQPQITATSLKHMNIIVPDNDVLLKFTNITEKIRNEIQLKFIEAQKLTELRDFLLPLLVNKQVGFD